MINFDQKFLGISLKYWILFCFIVLFCCYSVKENMTNTLNKPKLILYWAEWCPHCKNFLPVWNEFKNKVKNTNKYDIENYDCAKTQNRPICDVNDIPGYPTVIKQIGNNRIEYQGPRTVDGLMKFFEQ